MKHTPTPWQYNDGTGEIESGEVVIARMRGRTADIDLMDANGEHIVRCVNIHDDLMDALEHLLEHTDIPGYASEGVVGDACRLLAVAQAEKVLALARKVQR